MGSANAAEVGIETAGPLRIGVAGLGAVAQAVHLPLLAKHPDRFAIAALCDLSPSTRDALGDRYGVAPAHRFADARDLIDAGDPVKPWLSRTPIRRPPVSSGRAATARGSVCGAGLVDMA